MRTKATPAPTRPSFALLPSGILAEPGDSLSQASSASDPELRNSLRPLLLRTEMLPGGLYPQKVTVTKISSKPSSWTTTSNMQSNQQWKVGPFFLFHGPQGTREISLAPNVEEQRWKGGGVSETSSSCLPWPDRMPCMFSGKLPAWAPPPPVTEKDQIALRSPAPLYWGPVPTSPTLRVPVRRVSVRLCSLETEQGHSLFSKYKLRLHLDPSFNKY